MTLSRLHWKIYNTCEALTLQRQGCQLSGKLLRNWEPPLKDVQLHLRAECHKVLRQDDAYLKEELVAGDLLDELARVRGVELDAQVESDRAHPLDLLGHPLRRVQPMLQTYKGQMLCGSFCDRDEGSD